MEIITAAAGEDAEEIAAQYAADPDVEYAEPDYEVRALDTVPNDPRWGGLWGMRKIEAPRAWDVQRGDPSVVVAVIDTGIDYTHPDLAGNLWVNPGEIPGNGLDDDGNGLTDDVYGYDFANEDGDPLDDHGHGTHVAGTVGAVGNNGTGVVGVNWSVRIMSLKFLDDSGSGRTSDAVRALGYAVQMGARITSNSWGGSFFSQALSDAVSAARDAGCLVVAAAGNESSQFVLFPARYPQDNVISVAASDSGDALTFFSSYGAGVDLAAPGDNILSTMPEYQVSLNFDGISKNYARLSGTSMATPHVAGVAALVLASAPALRYDEVRARILGGADVLPALNGLVETGARLNAATALSGLGIGNDTTPPTTVSDLAVIDATHRAVDLEWSAPADDTPPGRAALYDLRRASAPITEETWDGATPVFDEPFPASGGATESMTVDALYQGTTYYFALRSMDVAGNYSALSNVAVATTVALTPVDITVDAGDEQIGSSAGALPLPLRVRVTDAGGLGVSGVIVDFALAEGAPGAFLTPETAITDPDGLASSVLTLGQVVPRTPGAVHRVAASAAGLAPVELQAGALPTVVFAGGWDPDPYFDARRAETCSTCTKTLSVHDLTVGDADGDGLGEILLAVTWREKAPHWDLSIWTEELLLLEATADNQFEEVWRYRDPDVNRFMSVTIADSDGDGRNEILVVAEPDVRLISERAPLRPFIFESDGDNSFVRQTHPISVPVKQTTQPINDFNHLRQTLVADTNGNGVPEIVLVWSTQTSGTHIHIWEHDGAFGQPDYSLIFASDPANPLIGDDGEWTIGDADGDGRLEVIGRQREDSVGVSRYEYNELTGSYDPKPGIDMTQVIPPDAPLPEVLATRSTVTVAVDTNGDGSIEVVAPGYYGCMCRFTTPDTCPTGNIAVFAAIAEDTFAPISDNMGTLPCAGFPSLSSAQIGSLNVLAPEFPAIMAGGRADAGLVVAYTGNPFPFPANRLVQAWSLGADEDHWLAKVGGLEDLDADGRPELVYVVLDDEYDLRVLEEDVEIGFNVAPVLRPIGPQSGFTGQTLTIQVRATDINQDVLVIGASNLPAGAEFDDVRNVLTWTPSPEQFGAFAVRFTVSDGELSDSADVDIYIQRDLDLDGIGDAPEPFDNCPTVPNASQSDLDGDGIGDACDTCRLLPGAPQDDSDQDGLGDACDNCPFVPNEGQEDADADGLGDACDACPLDAANDADADGVCGDVDVCPNTADPEQADGDGDGVGDLCDNCGAVPNSDQRDTDGDGQGDVCDGTINACIGGTGVFTVDTLRVRFGTPRGTRLVLRGRLGLQADVHVHAGADVTAVLVADGVPYLSAQAAGSYFKENRAKTRYRMRASGDETDGLSNVRLSRLRAGYWRVLVKGEGLSLPSAAPQSMGVLVRVGEGCYAASQPLTCALTRSGTTLRCQSQ